MKVYSCIAYLAGEIKNQVPKINVTVPEIFVLRAIHGEDAVHSIKVTGDIARSDKDERKRLADLYNGAFRGNDPTRGQPTSIDGIFGVGTPLPIIADGIENVITVDEPVKRTKVGRPAKGGTVAAEKVEEADQGDELADLG